MSHVHRLRSSDRIVFVTVNLRRRVEALRESEYPLILQVIEASRRRLGFLLCGYVLMPDHWHSLIWTGYPVTISEVIHDVKKVAARKLHGVRGTKGTVWQHQFWDRFVRHGKEFNDRLMYMHLNPVRRGLVQKPEEWCWQAGADLQVCDSRRPLMLHPAPGNGGASLHQKYGLLPGAILVVVRLR